MGDRKQETGGVGMGREELDFTLEKKANGDVIGAAT